MAVLSEPRAVTCPIWPGLVTEADTYDEIPLIVADAANALLEAYEELK